MIFETYTLQNSLQNYIESIFYFKDFIPDHSIERVVPTGHVFVIFELDGISRNTFDNVSLKPNGTFTKVWISGMHKNYLSISAHQNSEMFVIQFKPYGAYPFLNIPIYKLNNQVRGAQEILGREILELRKSLVENSTPKEKFDLAENWLLKRFDTGKLPNKELVSTIQKLIDQPLSQHKQIVDSYPKTQKHFIDQMKVFCGLTPKVFHRIVRFNEILQQIRQEKKINWSQIAYQFGYSDQSHFIKEFKEFSGFNPQEFIDQDYDKGEPNFFPLDREG